MGQLMLRVREGQKSHHGAEDIIGANLLQRTGGDRGMNRFRLKEHGRPEQLYRQRARAGNNAGREVNCLRPEGRRHRDLLGSCDHCTCALMVVMPRHFSGKSSNCPERRVLLRKMANDKRLRYRAKSVCSAFAEKASYDPRLDSQEKVEREATGS